MNLPIVKKEIPQMLITAQNRDNPPVKEIISKNWPILHKCSATRPLPSKEIMVTFKKPKSIKGILARAMIPKDKQRLQPQCKRHKTCQY